MDAGSLEIRAIDVTGSRVGDAPMLPELLDQIPRDQAIASVRADGDFDSRASHEAIAARQLPLVACAIIPARSHGQALPETTPGVTARNEIVRSSRRFGRVIWKRWSGYHQRSLVETKMHCFKLLGNRIMARDLDRQVAELQIRAAILNRSVSRNRMPSKAD